MVSITDIDPNEFIKELSETLKSVPEIKAPLWARFVKTGHFKERPPFRNDWWHTRSAAVLRTVERLGPVGVSKLRTKYGGKKNRGMTAEKFYKGSGSVARKILQQLEKAGLVAQAAKKTHKGRIVTPKGQSLLDKVTIGILKEQGFFKKEKPAAKEAGKEELPAKTTETARQEPKREAKQTEKEYRQPKAENAQKQKVEKKDVAAGKAAKK